MLRLIHLVLICLCASCAVAAGRGEPERTTAATPASSLDSARMEEDLQQLNWKQFRSVVEAIPKLKADIEAYGPVGWDIVRANYMNYRWKKNIDRLDDTQKQKLAELIEKTKVGK